MWEKFGTSGNGVVVDSSVGVDVTASCEVEEGLDVERGCGGVIGRGEGVAKVGWQAEARKEARTIIHKRRVLNFISASLFTDYKSKIQMH